MRTKHLSDIPLEPVKAGEGVTFHVLVGPDEVPNFAMRRFVMEPGGGMPRHTNLVEHEQFVLRGHARIGIRDDIIEVDANDIVFIPAGVPHWYQNSGTEPFEFLCLVPNKPDKVEILE